MVENWKGVCHRCNSPSIAHTMSYLNTQLICMECDEKEQKHSDYKEARAEEARQVQSGNVNYLGLLSGKDI